VNATNLNVLGTALIRIRDKGGQWIPVQALIDSGSQISAITHGCALQLQLPRRPTTVNVVGLSQNSVIPARGCGTCTMIPHTSMCPEITCEVVILSRITGSMPPTSLDPRIRTTYADIHFAGPSFDQPGRVDFLLGADIYNQIFKNGYQVRHVVGLPSAFETSLG